MNKQQRLDAANKLIEVIASCGRRFFNGEGRIAYLGITHGTNRLVWHDHWTPKEVHLRRGGKWRGFTGGGTLRAIVENLAEFIRTGKQLRAEAFGPWSPNTCNGGDLWGYGDDMAKVREAAASLGVTVAPSAPPPAGKDVS